MAEVKLNLTYFMNSIYTGKKPIVWTKAIEKAYNPFIINRALANSVDCILYVNEMNNTPKLSKKQHYTYLFNSVKKYKRPFGGFVVAAKKADEDIVMIQTLFMVNMVKADEIMEILSDEQLKVTKLHWNALNTTKDNIKKMKKK